MKANMMLSFDCTPLRAVHTLTQRSTLWDDHDKISISFQAE